MSARCQMDGEKPGPWMIYFLLIAISARGCNAQHEQQKASEAYMAEFKAIRAQLDAIEACLPQEWQPK